MIQRIQSVYLFGVAVLSVVMFMVPFGIVGDYTLTAISLANADEVLKETYPLAGLIGAGLIVSVISIFLFKNRKLQIKVCALSMIVQAAILAVAMFLYLDGTATELKLEQPTYAIGTFYRQ